MGGAGDGGFAEQQAATEAKKQEARDALNVLFGAGAGARPVAGNFTIPYNGTTGGGSTSAGGGNGTGEGASPGTSANGPGSPGEGPGGLDAMRMPTTYPSGSAAKPQAADVLPPWVSNPGDGSTGGGNPPTPVVPVGPQPGDLDRAGFKAAMDQWRADRDASRENRQGRNELYREVRGAAFDAGNRELGEDRDQAARKLKFELFARGLNGGSEDVDQNALLGRTYSEGVLDLGAKADAAKADFRGADESTRLNLLQSIDAGMDMGSALSAATNGLKVSSDKAAADAQGTSLGNLFDNAGLMYQYGQYAQGKQGAQQAGWQMFPGNSWNRQSSSNAASGVSSNSF